MIASLIIFGVFLVAITAILDKHGEAYNPNDFE